MVCKHKNEWSYTMDEIKPEVKELYDFGIQLEEVTAEKQKLETERDDSLAKMETKIENLMWWDEASKKTYTAPIKEEDKTKTSSTKRPSMLPEGTVVEEIPQKDVVPLDNKTTAAKPDAKPPEDSIPTTSTTAAPAPETKVEEKEVPPKRMFPSTDIVHHFHPIAWVEQMKLIFGTQAKYCTQEMKVRAFLRLIKYKEGKPGEEGYRQLFGGKSFSGFNDHPKNSETYVVNGKSITSDAAGAYQIMGGTWDTSPLNDKKEKYGVKDFSPLSQDYAALVLLKYQKKDTKPSDYQVKNWGNKWADKMIKKWKMKYPKITRDSFPKHTNRYINATGDIIQMLIDNDLDKALLTAAITWASFPDSIYGQEPSSYSIVDAKVKFRELLLQEIKGETDLYLEEGFLKKLGYKCCDSQNNAITGTSPEGKEPIDLRLTIPWHSQFTADTFGPYHHQSWMCYDTSLMILQEFVGLTAGGKRGNKSTTVNGRDLGTSNNVIQVSLENTEVDGSYTVTVPVVKNTETGIVYLDQELEKGNPILVGVRHTYKKVKKTKGYKYEQNYDKSTDHFVIVVGRGYENGKRYFLFYEVGTSCSDKGQHDKNRLFVNDDWSIAGIPQHNLTRTYTLTQVRGNKTNGNFK